MSEVFHNDTPILAFVAKKRNSRLVMPKTVFTCPWPTGLRVSGVKLGLDSGNDKEERGNKAEPRKTVLSG